MVRSNFGKKEEIIQLINLDEITRSGVNKSGRYNNGGYFYNHENRTLLIDYFWDDDDSDYSSSDDYNYSPTF